MFATTTQPVEIAEPAAKMRSAKALAVVEPARAPRRKAGASPRRPMIGSSPAMRRLQRMIEQVAASDATVMILGESGTGKELVAEAIHALSSRAGGPLVKINCAAIPDNLLEDELFGHEKGAFTSANTERKGRFEMADGGTIFLDEIGDMPHNLQAKILRILQEREFERLGGTRTIKVDVRILCATNRDLDEMLRDGSLREDLYYRINVIPLSLPPLRERREDIPALAEHFVRQAAEKNGHRVTGISDEAIGRLAAHGWPGNVRELQNWIERTVVLAPGPEIRPDDLPRAAAAAATRTASDLADQFFALGISLDELEKRLIEEGLRRSGGTQSVAARLLGLTRRTLQYRVEKHSIHVRTKPA